MEGEESSCMIRFYGGRFYWCHQNWYTLPVGESSLHTWESSQDIQECFRFLTMIYSVVDRLT